MTGPGRPILTAVASALICLLSFPTPSQTPTQQTTQDQADVVRVFTELVQTDVMVFGKDGKFKDDLRREDFELRIDGKVKPIEFFERVQAGSVNEEAQLAAARGAGNARGSKLGAVPLDRGRSVFFYVDDFHFDLPAAKATRKLITDFIDNEMGQNDEAAISSASGQVGFLQQITDNKTVLRRALERLNPRPYNVTDNDRPPMSEYLALKVDGFDRDVTDYFIDALLRDNPFLTRDMAQNMVKSRATGVLHQASYVTQNSLVGLESLVRSAVNLPGRKVLFFISNGFFIDDRNSDGREKLRRITGAAARSGVVIYAVDSRGLAPSMFDASTAGNFDTSGRLALANSGELTASQEAMGSLAFDTGGRPIFNTNDPKPGLKNALKETSTYYLLAWKPEQQESSNSHRFRRIEVKLIGKSDLSVRVRRGFYDVEPPIAGDTKTVKKPAAAKAQEKKPESKLWQAITAPLPERGIPFSLRLLYTNTPERGGLLSAAVQVPTEFLTYSQVDGKPQRVIELAGGIYNDHGQAGARFNERVTLGAPKPGAVGQDRGFAYTFPVFLGPGLYQARVGVRDVASGKSGTVVKWIEVPKLVPGELAMSSLHLGERDPSILRTAAVTTANSKDEVSLSIDHRFRNSNYLRFLVFIYNAARSAADTKPDVAIQVQLIRDKQPVMTTALKKVQQEGIDDLSRLPYAAELSLADLSPGLYVLKVTVVDRVSKRSASQEAQIEIE